MEKTKLLIPSSARYAWGLSNSDLNQGSKKQGLTVNLKIRSSPRKIQNIVF
jgi:hypothetical protein